MNSRLAVLDIWTDEDFAQIASPPFLIIVFSLLPMTSHPASISVCIQSIILSVFSLLGDNKKRFGVGDPVLTKQANSINWPNGGRISQSPHFACF